VRDTGNWLYSLFHLKSFALMTHPDTSQFVLKNEEAFPKEGDTFGDFGPLLHNSMVSNNGEAWKNVKEILAPAFHFEYIKNMVPIFTSKAESLFDLWAETEKDISIKSHLGHFTLDTLGLTAFGVDFNSTRGGSHSYLEAYEHLISFNPNKLKKDVADATERLTQMTKDIVAAKSAVEKGSAGERDFLDRMISERDRLTQEQIRNNVFLLFIAGHETTAHTLTWELYFFGLHPEMQQKARDEVDVVLKGNVPNSENVKSLTFLDMFIKEVLRHRPSVANLITRKASEDTQVGQYIIPKGSDVGISIYTVHHLKEFWPEPDKFDPLRFTPERSNGRHPFAYMPFSLGRRNCIGNNFSILEQKIFLAMFLQRFTLELNAKTDADMVPMVFACWAKNIVVDLTPRKIPFPRAASTRTAPSHA